MPEEIKMQEAKPIIADIQKKIAIDRQGVRGQEQFDFMKLVINSVVIVLFIGFAGLLIAVGAILQNYLVSKQATYENLRDKVLEQNFKIQEQSEKIDNLSSDIKSLIEQDKNNKTEAGESIE